MKGWILSIGVIVIILSIVTLILPEGKMGKFIKGFISLLMVFVMIKPLLYIKDNDFSIPEFLQCNDVVIQENYLSFNHELIIKDIDRKCKTILKDIGVEDGQIKIDYLTNDNYKLVINKVIINLTDSVIIPGKTHIDIIEEIRTKISEVLKIDKSIILFE